MISLCFTLLLPVFGLNPSKPPNRYTLNRLTTEDGLPQSSVMNIVQTRDGYLWLGTFEGLARYDGRQFSIFNKSRIPELKNNTIKALFEDSRGSLWIGTPAGLIRYRLGRFRNFTARNGLTGNLITSISEDQNHRLWIGTTRGLNRYNPDGSFTLFSIENGIRNRTITALAPATDGGMWIGTPTGLDHILNGTITHLSVPDNFPEMRIRTLYMDPTDNSLWIGIHGKGLIRLRNQKFTRIGNSRNNLTDVRAILRSREGTLWIGSNGGGLFSYSKTGKFSVLSEKEGLSNQSVRALLEDHEGSLWIGTRSGLFQLKDDKFTLFSSRNGLPVDSVRSLLSTTNGNIWIGTVGGGLARFKSGRFTPVNILDARYIWSLAEGPDHSLWVGSYGKGVFHLTGKEIHSYSTQNGLSNNVIRAILILPGGEIWLGTNGGGINIISKTGIRTLTRKDGLSGNYIYSLARDRDGAIWAGTYNNGVNRILNGKITVFSEKDGFTNTGIWAIHPDPDGSIWFCTGNSGLFHYKNRHFHQFTMETGLYSDSIFSITDDKNGNLWMNCNRGIFTVKREALAEVEEGKRNTIYCRSFGKREGIKATESNGPAQFAACLASDGSLWFSSIRGAIVINPRTMPTNTIPPPITIESVRINNKKFSPYTPIRTAVGQGRMEIRYAALSFLLPEKVQFQYQLKGFDSNWINPGHRQTAYYTNLPPGEYRFQVIACNNDGIWNKTGKTISITLQPRFTQTNWFKALILLFVGLCLLALYRLRVKQIRHREFLLQTKVMERTQQLDALNRKLADLARTDSLTGIPNHRHLMHQLKKEWKTAVRESAPLSLIFIDIDRFKQYNDTFGHQAGDNCLKKIAEMLQQKLQRPRDFLARYGGEEFVAILPDTPKKGAVSIAESLRLTIEKNCNPETDGFPTPTISLGVSTVIPRTPNNFEILLRAADAALYQSKNTGRNRVSFLETTPSAPSPNAPDGRS